MVLWAALWFTAWLLVVFGVKPAAATRRTGDSDMRGINAPAGLPAGGAASARL